MDYEMERKVSAAFEVFSILFAEIFWSMYRKDDDIIELLKKIFDCNCFTRKQYQYMYCNIRKTVNTFCNMKNTGKKSDDDFIRDNVLDIVAHVMVMDHNCIFLLFKNINEN